MSLNSMEYIKKNQKALIPFIFALVIGFVIGVFTKPNSEGIYISSQWFTLGRTVTPIADLNLKTISDADVSVLIGKIEKETPSTAFGRKLRDMASKAAGAGPFKHVVLKEHLILNIVEDNSLGYGFAKVCVNSPLFGQLLIASNATNPGYGNISFRANNNSQIQDCKAGDQETEPYKVWINKQDLAAWFPDNVSPDNLSVAAIGRLVISDN